MEMLQHAVVTLVALAASAAVFRRAFRFARPPRTGETACSGCPSTQVACGATTPATRGPTIQHPAILIRASAHVRSQTSRIPTRRDDAIAIGRWEGVGGARKSPAEEERDARVDDESRQRPCATTSKRGDRMPND
jgi:hypothetical protein